MKKGFLTFTFLLMCILSGSISKTGFCQPDTQSGEILKMKQKEFLSWKFGMFIHFNLSTFIGREWATGQEDPLVFNPKKLDCGQWADVARSAGMKYGVLTVKHTGGWCLWDSKYTKHDIAQFSDYKNGKGDLVKEYVEAFRSRGLKVGLYYCLPGNYSNSDWSSKLECAEQDMHGLFPEATGDFEWYIEKQVEELLTSYGPIDLIWFDQYMNPYTGKYWQNLKALVNKLQPDCIVIANNSKKFEETDIIGYEYPYLKLVDPENSLPHEGNTNPAEVNDCLDIRGWFWHPGGETLQPLEDVVKMVKLCNSRHSNYLLDVPPNTDGLIPELYAKHLRGVGEKLQ